MTHIKPNLLGESFSASGRRRRKILFWIRNAAVGLAVLLCAAILVIVVPSIGAVRILYENAEAGKADLMAAQDAANTLDFQKAEASLSDAVTKFETAQDAAGRLQLLAKLPVLGDDVRAAQAALAGGRDASYALQQAVGIAADLVSVFKSGVGSGIGAGLGQENRSVNQISRDERRKLLQEMTEAPGRLAQARDALDSAIASFDRIPDVPSTKGLLAAIAPYREKLTEMRGYLSTDLSILSKIPLMAGYPSPKTYLFLMLNNTELRPGGGFIGTYGIVKVSDGAIDSFFTDDSYALDGPAEATLRETPPDPIRRYLRTPYWFMRDANWSPDFAVSAMQVEHFYHAEGGKEAQIDGVIGVTPTIISRLLAITGPITIEGARFDANNVTDELEYQVERGFAAGGVPYAQRKDVVGKLGQALMQKVLAMPVSDLVRLAGIAQDAVNERQLMAVFKDPDLQVTADAHGWSGRFTATPGDFLSVIDANMASLKSDPAVARTVSYSLRPSGGSFIARAQVTYVHHGTFNWKTTRYRTYTRFYVPLGSAFIKGEGMMQDDKLNDPGRHPGTIDVGQDLGRTTFGGFISIEPGETRTLAVEYRVSDAVAAMLKGQAYRLDAKKELGTPANALTLDLAFGKNVVRAAPAEDQKEWGDTRYRLATDLGVDRVFTVDLAK